MESRQTARWLTCPACHYDAFVVVARPVADNGECQIYLACRNCNHECGVVLWTLNG